MAEAGPTEKTMSEIICSFCRGTGKDPFGIMSWQSVCSVCHGRSVLMSQRHTGLVLTVMGQGL